MNVAKMKICAYILAAGLMDSGAALADKCAGYNVNNMISIDTTEMSKGNTLTTFRHSSVFVSENPKSSYHMAAGECGGTLVTTSDGKSRGAGNCTRVDKDGDAYHEEWSMEPSTEWIGTWRLLGGTGKYANASGTGTWQVVLSHGKMGAVRWTGTCE